MTFGIVLFFHWPAWTQAPLACIQPRGKVRDSSKQTTPNGTFRLDNPSAQLLQIKSLRGTAQLEGLLQRTPSNVPSVNVKTTQSTTYRLTVRLIGYLGRQDRFYSDSNFTKACLPSNLIRRGGFCR